MVKAHAFHQAVASGTSTDNLSEARSVGYGIGIAFGIFVMMITAGMFSARAMYGAGVVGILMRAAVSHDRLSV